MQRLPLLSRSHQILTQIPQFLFMTHSHIFPFLAIHPSLVQLLLQRSNADVMVPLLDTLIEVSKRFQLSTFFANVLQTVLRRIARAATEGDGLRGKGVERAIINFDEFTRRVVVLGGRPLLLLALFERTDINLTQFLTPSHRGTGLVMIIMIGVAI